MAGAGRHGAVSLTDARSADLINTILLLLPFLLPVTAAVLVLTIARLRPGFGFAWLAAFLASLVNWGLLIYLRFSPPAPVIFSSWLPLGGVSGSLVFQLDDVAWVYTFSLSSLLVLIVMTVPARLANKSNPGAWASCLALAGVGNLAMMAATPLAIVLAWMAIDIFELVVILVGVPSRQIKVQAFVAFAARVFGTLILILAMILSRSEGRVLILVDPGAQVGIFILLSVGLRLGVLPLHLPYTQEVPMRRGLGTILRLTSPLASLMLLARLPMTVVPVEFSPILLGLASIAAVYGAGMWASASQEVSGRPYGLISVAGMAVACSIRGYPLASMAWGVTLAFSGGMIFLYSVRDIRLIFIPIIGALFLSGLPLMPAASGWNGLVVLPLNIPDFLFWLAQALLLFGYLRFGLSFEKSAHVERWIWALFPSAYVLMFGSAILLTVVGWAGSLSVGIWWASIPAALFAVGGFLVYRRLIREGVQTLEDRWFVVIGRRVGRVFSKIFSLDWLYRLLRWIFSWIQVVVRGLTTIIEGEGGVLWVFVLLAVVITISLSGAAR